MAEGVRKRGKTWSYYFDVAPINGERKKIEKGGFRTQKEALEARIKAMNEYNSTGRTFSPKDISVADYLDYWLENAIKKNIGSSYSHNTYQDYESKVRIHFKPAFGMYRLSAFQYSPDVIQRWVDGLKINGLSKNMINNTFICLQGALNYAIHPLNYIQTNPCTFVKIGRMPENKDRKKHREYICTKEEFSRILERFPFDSNYYPALIFPYHTGTRIGETFAINFLEDIDFKNHEIHIENQLVKINKTWFFKAPKYESRRTIKMGNTLESELKKLYQLRRENQLRFGSHYLKTYILPDNSIMQMRADISMPYKEIMPLCTKDNGELLTPESFKYCSRVIHHELGNPLFHSHSLRHTHGTILAESGVNPKTVMERLGHKDITTTLQTYTFNTEMMQQSAVDAFENAI